MTYSRLSVIPLVTETCLAVVSESGNDTEYFIGRIDWLLAEQPHLFQKLIESAHKITCGIIEDVESDEYGYIFTNALCMAIQVYLAIDKQVGIQLLEE